MKVLGLSAFYHDSAAALVSDGRIVAAAQEERFTRKKFDEGFPRHSIAYCLEQAGIKLRDVDRVVFYDKPFLKFERLLDTYLAFAPRGFVSFQRFLLLWVSEKLFQKSLLSKNLKSIDAGFESGNRLLFSEHHYSHAASAFFASPFTDAAVLTMDGVGEWTTTSVAIGTGSDLRIMKEIHFPHSLGLLYSAFTYYAGFRVNSGEYKLMGLAPYGRPLYTQRILDNLIDLKADGSFRLNMLYFDYCTGLKMTNGRFDALMGAPARTPDQPLTQFHMDVAASIQAVTEEAVLRLGRSVAAETGKRNLCLAGGVALNCVANGKLLRAGIFEQIWVQPAAGDAGGALGAALAGYHSFLGQPRVANEADGMNGTYLGPEFASAEIRPRLAAAGAKFTMLDDDALLQRTAQALSDGKAVGWMQGRMEFGPRALGNRSILADPRSPHMQKTLNLRIKFRESFRPFAPAILEEDLGEWFDIDRPSPYMGFVADVQAGHRLAAAPETEGLFGIDRLNLSRSDIPAVTHIDYSARLQTVSARTNPRFHALISRFKLLTGCPILVNTSFNVRSEPIVQSPEDAFRCFMGSDIEILVVGNAFLLKDEQHPALKRDYRDQFEPD